MLSPPDHARDVRVAEYRAVSGREVFPVAEATLETGPARALWGWWQSAATAGRVPERGSFDIAEYPLLAAHLFLVEPIPGSDGEGYRLRLAGEAFTGMFQRRKGHVWRRDAAPLDRAMAGYFDFVAEAGRPFRSIGRLRCAWSDWFAFESLVCPLADRGATLLMGAAAPIDDEEPL